MYKQRQNKAVGAHKYTSKEAQDGNLDMLIHWIQAYPTRDDVFSLKAHMQFFEAFQGKKLMYVDNNRKTMEGYE